MPILTRFDNTFRNYFETMWVMKSAYRYLNISSCIVKPKSLKLIYIQRAGARQIVNEGDVLDALNKQIGLEVLVTRLENIPPVSQVRLFSAADIAFGVHGAGFVNIVWLMPYSGLFEILNPKFYRSYYSNMAFMKKLFYTCFHNATVSKRFSIADPRDLDVKLDIQSFVMFMRTMVVNIMTTKYALVYCV